MLKSSGFWIALFINIIIIALWHVLSYILSAVLPKKHIHDDRIPFRIRDFERRGEFYVENFAVDKWYNTLPGHLIKWDFSKTSFEERTFDSLQQMVQRTCRIELWSLLNCTYFLCAWILDAAYLAFILSAVVIIANAPYIICSRYSRCMILNAVVNKRRESKQKRVNEINNTLELYLSS